MVITPPGVPKAEVTVLVDGRSAPTPRGLRVAGKVSTGRLVHELHVQIPKRDCEISLVAQHRWGKSHPATVHLRWRKHEAFPIKPKLYVLAVGMSQYNDPALSLCFPGQDAQAFAKALQHQAGGLYREVVAKTLIDAQATKGNILDGLDWIDRETTSKDVAILFFAGHGVNDKGGIYYFLTVNADTDRLRRTSLPFSDIKNTVAALSGKTLLFVDTCHAGNIMGVRRGVADINALVNELSSAENGAVVFASSTGRQYALEDPTWGNGAFTKALVEGLTGGADYRGTGTVTINMLDLYLSERVKALTKGQQTPTTTKPQTIQDFPVAVTE